MGGSAITREARPTAGSSRYIGRVGGLAFALGVGAAVLAGPGLASAETSEPGTSETTSASVSSTASESSAAEQDSVTSEESEAEAAEAEAEAESEAAAEAEAEAEAAVEVAEIARPESEFLDEATEAESNRAATTAAQSAAPDDASPAAAAPTLGELIDSFFDNDTPSLDHDPSENSVVDGTIQGQLHPEDADSSRLTFTATDPSHGSVVINSDGSFVYTPDDTFAGQDRFDVTVSDARSGLHIHGLAGLLNLVSFGLLGNSGHRSTETVFIGFERAVVVPGLDTPVDFRFLPDGRILVTEKAGAIKVVENGALRDEPVITLSVNTLGERGISGLAVDPDFADNGYLYVSYVSSANRNQLSRLTMVGNTAGTEVVLLQSGQSSAVNHHGGALGFGPDGTLYWGVGDNGNGANSQDLTNIHGKILRLNPDGSIPADNPAIPGALPQIYAYGLRNPFRLTFTPDGKLLVADVGAASFEELNLITAGGDYGWPGAEGVCDDCDSINPIYTYPRGGGAAITSVLVYDGDTFGPDYVGKVFIADLVQGWIRVLTCTPEFTSCGDAQTFDPDAGSTVVLAQGPDGNVYQLLYQPGSLVRIAPAGEAEAELA
ncbi:PQQ-dependent sugar dehydrogenase [Mycolicibacterium sp. OfavD-34-C]|uniref:PQQ-dependent sugar dehydrogenase n=1 Tax=Mycolicibacterium sp. OfavD-34-C TaxID=2917746 RepID=UPI001EF648C5|nr:PQQ-dependent sugar dehydrogenase [Mycolicibacterium sp. OfavD-34-C]MCG7578740.1 PQQ-dependent sugar dehydrogenase [Mycolicibacterium sp. OfavD-34-C]